MCKKKSSLNTSNIKTHKLTCLCSVPCVFLYFIGFFVVLTNCSFSGSCIIRIHYVLILSSITINKHSTKKANTIKTICCFWTICSSILLLMNKTQAQEVERVVYKSGFLQRLLLHLLAPPLCMSEYCMFSITRRSKSPLIF